MLSTVQGELKEHDDNHARTSVDEFPDQAQDAAIARLDNDKEVDNDTIKTLSNDTPAEEVNKPVTWSSLPRKDQLFILAFARLAEPLFQTSINSYLFFMLRSFDVSLSDSTIASQAGFISGGFTAAQCLTAVLWGRVADRSSVGRKNVLIIGLLGTLVSAIGFGFSRSFASALFFRCLGGLLNGNVSVLRTMTSEIIKEKKFQTKAFLLMPVMFNVGILLGPVLGGVLQDPVRSFPGAFGPGSKLGGEDGVAWMLRFPYALPNMVNGFLLLVALVLVVLGLEETHIDRRHLYDPGVRIRQAIVRAFGCNRSRHKYTPLEMEESSNFIQDGMQPLPKMKEKKTPRRRLPLRRILRPNVLATFLAHGLITGHIGAFQNLWFLFLSTPRFDPAHPDPPGYEPHPPLFFQGGLGLSPATIGTIIGTIGAMGLLLQFGIYSWTTSRLGPLYTYRYALILFPIAYGLAPFLALVPTKSEAPHAVDGPWIWVAIGSLLLVIVAGRTLALPSSLILINNCAPHPSVLSTIHGIAQSVSAGSRTLGPLVFSTLYGEGLKKGAVGMAWWILMVEAFVACAASWLVYDGSGNEIELDEE